jgi:DNA-binding protein WhiA
VLDPSAVSPLLRSAGQLRVDHPDLSITALAALADPPVTKSALAGRLRRLAALSNAHNSPGPFGL